MRHAQRKALQNLLRRVKKRRTWVKKRRTLSVDKPQSGFLQRKSMGKI
jgi:hypothetical protein